MNSNKLSRIIFSLLIFLFISIPINLYQSAHSLTTAAYTLTASNITHPFRIVQITDLHNSIFGSQNSRLVNLIAAQSPDLILMTGDLLNSGENRTDVAVKLIADLQQVAPVYISLGNHEVEFEQKYSVDIRQLYTDAGGVVLDGAYQDIMVNGEHIRLGGIYGYCLPEKYLETGEASRKECDFLSDFQNTDAYTILMCHMPVCWLLNHGLDEWQVDCVLSGHAHGGQVILPLIGGLYAPDFGMFPGRLRGIFSSSDGRKKLVLATGLGNTERIPRFNNKPEIVTVNFQPEKS